MLILKKSSFLCGFKICLLLGGMRQEGGGQQILKLRNVPLKSKLVLINLTMLISSWLPDLKAVVNLCGFLKLCY